MPYREVAPGVHIYYDDEGSGRPLVLLHGLWASGRCFAGQVGRLSDRFRVVVPDLRAHGRSAHVPHGHTVETYAHDVRRLIEPLGIVAPLLIGWSLGAQVAWEYVRQFGAAAAAGLVIVGQAASPRRADRVKLARRMGQMQIGRAAVVQELVPLPEMQDEALRIPESIAGAILFEHSIQDYRLVVTRSSVPTLWCYGRRDPQASLAAIRRLVRRLDSATLRVFPESGACPFHDEPEAFEASIQTFVESLRPSTFNPDPRRAP